MLPVGLKRFILLSIAHRPKWNGEGVGPSTWRGALIQPAQSGNEFLAEIVIGLRALLGLSVFILASDGALEVDLERNLTLNHAVKTEVTLSVLHPQKSERSLPSSTAVIETQEGHLFQEACFSPISVRLNGEVIQQP